MSWQTLFSEEVLGQGMDKERLPRVALCVFTLSFLNATLAELMDFTLPELSPSLRLSMKFWAFSLMVGSQTVLVPG
jgi:hypothetical protein